MLQMRKTQPELFIAGAGWDNKLGRESNRDAGPSLNSVVHDWLIDWVAEWWSYKIGPAGSRVLVFPHWLLRFQNKLLPAMCVYINNQYLVR